MDGGVLLYPRHDFPLTVGDLVFFVQASSWLPSSGEPGALRSCQESVSLMGFKEF